MGVSASAGTTGKRAIRNNSLRKDGKRTKPRVRKADKVIFGQGIPPAALVEQLFKALFLNL
jgi:hypothetical protein